MQAAPSFFTPAFVAALRAVDTPTVCNALELAMGTRTAQGFTRGTVVAAPSSLPPMLGFARTARIRAATPSSAPASEVHATRLAYYRYVADTNGLPCIVVMEDQDDTPGIGSFWGEVNSHVHRGLGLAGVLTNGSVRDLGMLAPDFPVLAGSVGPSHAFVHVEAVGVPVSVFGLAIRPGDLLHADLHGAVVIPPGLAAELPRCIDAVMRKEAPILAAARAPGFGIAALERALQDAAEIH